MAIGLGKKLMMAEKIGEIKGLCNEIGKDSKMEYLGEVEINGTNYLFYCHGCEKVHVINRTCEIPKLRFIPRFKSESNKNQGEYLI